jgi:hypothetical protein
MLSVRVQMYTGFHGALLVLVCMSSVVSIATVGLLLPAIDLYEHCKVHSMTV